MKDITYYLISWETDINITGSSDQIDNLNISCA